MAGDARIELMNQVGEEKSHPDQDEIARLMGQLPTVIGNNFQNNDSVCFYEILIFVQFKKRLNNLKKKLRRTCLQI